MDIDHLDEDFLDRLNGYAEEDSEVHESSRDSSLPPPPGLAHLKLTTGTSLLDSTVFQERSDAGSDSSALGLTVANGGSDQQLSSNSNSNSSGAGSVSANYADGPSTLRTLIRAPGDELVNDVDEDDIELDYSSDDEGAELWYQQPAANAASEPMQSQEMLIVEKHFPEVAGKYAILAKIGEGTYSSVFKAKPLTPLAPVDNLRPEQARELEWYTWRNAGTTIPMEGQRQPYSKQGAQQQQRPVSAISLEYVALKRIYPTSGPSKILAEASLLKTLGGKSNVIPLLGGLRFEDKVALIMPFVENHSAKTYMTSINVVQIRRYLRGMFRALAHLHKHQIIHRDIKPSNFLWNSDTMEFFLLDFGLAQSQQELEDYNQSVFNSRRLKLNPRKRKAFESAAGDPGGSSSDVVANPAKRLKPTLLDAQTPKITKSNPVQQQQPKPTAAQMKQARSEVARRLLSQLAQDNSKPKATPTTTAPSASSEVPPSSSQVHRKEERRPLAPRGGTRGFRAPEVLMRCTNQTVSLDIWSAGVIILCLLSRRYPFFHSGDDLDSLCEISSICGSKQVEDVARTLGKVLNLPTFFPRRDFRQLCEELRAGNEEAPPLEGVPANAYDLLERCLDLNPFTRITAAQALRHPFLMEID